MFQALLQKWKGLHANGATFGSFFRVQKLQLVKNCMSAKVRTSAGLGFPPDVYTQNANECMNSVIKRDTKGKKLSPKEAASAIEACVNEQESQVKLALIGVGELRLAEGHEQFQIKQNEFYAMSSNQRSIHVAKFHKAVVKVHEIPQTHASHSEMISPYVATLMSTAGTEIPLPRLTTTAGETDLCKLSVQPQHSKIVYPPYSVVEEMFQDASAMVTGDGVLQAPGASSTYIVLNTADAKNPFIINMVGNKIECSNEKCVRFQAYGICTHTIAVAETSGNLSGFLADFNMRNRQSLSSLVDIGHSSKAGKKATKATQKRKGAANKTRTALHTYKQPVKPTAPNPLPGVYNITLLQFCHERTSSCYGCGGDLKVDGRIPDPPRNLVLVSKTRREYYRKQDDGTGVKQLSPLRNVYFHFNTECVKKKNNFFVPCLAQVQNDVKPFLLPEHRDVLQSCGILL